MDILYEWKYVDYLWKNQEHKEKIINTGYRNNSIIIDVDEAPGIYFTLFFFNLIIMKLVIKNFVSNY